jgi:hypothetical protein
VLDLGPDLLEGWDVEGLDVLLVQGGTSAVGGSAAAS